MVINKNGIKGGGASLESFPLRNDDPINNMGEDLKAVITAVVNGEDFVYCEHSLTINYSVNIVSNNYIKSVSSGNDSLVIYKRIVGYYRSPYEKRIIIIVATFYAGIECESHLEYKLIGCHMGVGFIPKH